MAIPILPILGAAVAMAVVAMIMRRAGGGDIPPPPPGTAPDPRYDEGVTRAPERSSAEVLDDDEAADLESMADDDWEPDEGHLLAVTSTGQVFIPIGHDVRILPLEGTQAALGSGQVAWDDVKAAVLETARKSGGGLPGTQLDVGDFTAGRVVRGAPDHDPWRLELLGRDGEYQPHAFETQEAANTALDMLTRTGVVQRPLDDDGRPVGVPDAQFDAARREYDETLEELANMPDVEPGEFGGPR